MISIDKSSMSSLIDGAAEMCKVMFCRVCRLKMGCRIRRRIKEVDCIGKYPAEPRRIARNSALYPAEPYR